MKELKCVLQHRSVRSNTGDCRPSPSFELIEHSPSSPHKAQITNPGGELSSSLFLPTDSLRIKYLQERQKLWKQLTADFCHSDRDGEEYLQECQLPLVVSSPSGNIPPTTNNESDTEVKVLPKEVTTTFSNSPKNNYVWIAPRQEIVNSMQSTTARRTKAYHHQGTFGNVPPNNNPNFFAAVDNPHHPFTPYPTSHQLTPCPPPERAMTKLKGRDGNTSQTGEAKKKKRKRPKNWGKRFEVKFEELTEYKRKHGHCNVPRVRSANGGDAKMYQLGVWVNKTRQACNKYLSSGKQSSPGMYMDEDRMQRLKEIGFELSMAGVDTDMCQISVFSRRLKELKRFREVHDHLNVPRTGSFKSLGHWCTIAKKACRDFEAGRPVASNMKITSNRLDMLRAIGFDWCRKRNKLV